VRFIGKPAELSCW